MAELSRTSRYRATPDALIAEAERDSIVARLNTAYAVGEVDPERYPQLLDAAFGAKTLGELAPIIELLPVEATYEVPAVVETGALPPGQLSRAGQLPPLALALVIGAVVVALFLLVVLLGLRFYA